MKKNDLIEIIRVAVKEEVNNVLPQLLMEVLAERMVESRPSVSESKIPTQPPQQFVRRKPAVSLEGPLKMSPVAAPKMYAKDPILNQILNETRGGIPTEDETNSESAIDQINSLPPEVLSENKDVAAVANALNRDYRSLLKAVDSKRTQR